MPVTQTKHYCKGQYKGKVAHKLEKVGGKYNPDIAFDFVKLQPCTKA